MMSDDTGEVALRLAVSQRPEHVPARAALAAYLTQAGHRAEALDILRDGLFFAAGRDDRLESLADAFLAADSWPDAIDALQSAARVDPAQGLYQARLAFLWNALGETAKAAEFARRAEALGAAIDLPDSTGKLTPQLTRQLFNQYAAGFDRHLTALHYTVPAELHRALYPFLPFPPESLVIDLGCGTGLMGEQLRPGPFRLIGIDLSCGMLDQARGKGLYDELHDADIVEWLGQGDGQAVAILAADVLVYIGDLAPLFAQVARRLIAGGLFAFTVERHHGTGYALGATRRYAHSEVYIGTLAAQSGLTIVHTRNIVPRLDSGKPVDGLLFVLRKLIETKSST